MPKHPLIMVLPTHSSNNPNCHFNSCNNTLLMLFQRSWMKTKKGLVVDKEFWWRDEESTWFDETGPAGFL
jgi:hypothetical protein